MKKIEILMLVIIFLWAGLLFKDKWIYPFINEILPHYLKESHEHGNSAKISKLNPVDVEDLIYLPPVKDFKKIFLRKIIKDRYIEITIPENVLRLYILDHKIGEFVLKKIYPVSVGKPSTPSEIGEGIIYTKGGIVFKYNYGRNQGKVVEYTHMPDGSKIRIPYEKMRGLYMIINNSDRYVIHSTTEYWKIGKAVSMGCIRMLIEDMLELYPYIKPVMKVRIVYKLFELDDDLLTVYADIYKRSLNMYKDLMNFFISHNINPVIFDTRKLKRLLFQNLPVTVSLNELLNEYFISRNLTWDKIEIEDIIVFQKNISFIDFIDNFKVYGR